MHKSIVLTIVFLLICTTIHASDLEPCPQEDLTKYEITFHFDEKPSKLVGQISLPSFQKIEYEFCGYWQQDNLTEAKSKQYRGNKYKDKTIIINLSPQLYDAGLALSLEYEKGWPSEGLIVKKSYAGLFRQGKFLLNIK